MKALLEFFAWGLQILIPVTDVNHVKAKAIGKTIPLSKKNLKKIKTSIILG